MTRTFPGKASSMKARLRSVPLREKLSKIVVSHPSSRKWQTAFVPMNPAPPVMRILRTDCLVIDLKEITHNHRPIVHLRVPLPLLPQALPESLIGHEFFDCSGNAEDILIGNN